jgi:hypothetical protein
MCQRCEEAKVVSCGDGYQVHACGELLGVFTYLVDASRFGLCLLRDAQISKLVLLSGKIIS